jgi:hypothetical protein
MITLAVPTLRPHLLQLFAAPGDIVIFDHWTPHKTQSSEFPPYMRTSAEMRFST